MLQADLFESGERILWTGEPGQGVRVRRADRSMIPFSLLWLGFSIAWESWAIRDGRWGFVLWGVPFLIIGAQLTVGRFVSDARRRARTSYVLTDRRILVSFGGRRPSVSTFSLRTIPAVTLVEMTQGEGDIVLGFPTDGTSRWAAGARRARSPRRCWSFCPTFVMSTGSFAPRTGKPSRCSPNGCSSRFEPTGEVARPSDSRSRTLLHLCW
jgi:hypothetical protein